MLGKGVYHIVKAVIKAPFKSFVLIPLRTNSAEDIMADILH